MSRRLKPFHRLEGAQAEASDPTIHAALSASAGTGKTHVLTSRVLRLLLNGTPPSSILCLTFTKAGAAEMANRISERLAHWVRLSNADLAAELGALNEDYHPDDVKRARRLFAQVLEAPGGGLRIQTIHSFAQTLLASFPGEANIVPGFRPIEGRAEAELARRTLANLLAEAEASGRLDLLDDVSALSLRLGEQGAESYLLECARAHEAMAALGEGHQIEPALMALVGLEGADPDADLLDRFSDDAIDHALFDRLIAANRSVSGVKAAAVVSNLTDFQAATPAGRMARMEEVRANLVTKTGDACKASASLQKVDADYQALLFDFADWWLALSTLVKAHAAAKVQAAGLRAGQAFAAAYVHAKRAQGAADFDDLIAWTRRLLAQPGMGDWVRYKLDQRTDHILVDEAQDTNADQWEIVRALVEEFFSGNPDVEDKWRTLFMVGDYKQAIYGFQGTNPQEFENFRGYIAGKAQEVLAAADDIEARTRAFKDLSISASFRSSPAVLDVVDAVIGEVGHGAMGLGAPPQRHDAFNAQRPGRVELWPPFDPTVSRGDDEGEEGWIDEPTRLYADAIARQVRQWIDEAPTMASTKRPLAPGDVLILVRSRTELASLIVARLYAQGVPVAGIDRLHLHKPTAVKDLLAAIMFAVQPLDDLNLANALVSPLIGWDQQLLFDLAHGRGGRLWPELQRRREERDEFAAAHAILSDWLAMADYVPPSRFLETILSGPLDGRRKLIARLGEAARDPIAELVSSAMAFELEDVPTLDRFIAWFGQGEVEVKRDPSAPTDAVRVMTIHGAKGLEAPLVILADATHDPAKVGGTSATIDFPVGASGTVPLIRPRKDECAPIFRTIIDAQKEADFQEHWRLAYVGLTRAAERLVVAGVKPSRDVPEASWHRAVANAMVSLGAVAEERDGWGSSLVWEGSAATAPAPGKAKKPLTLPVVPSWLREVAPPEARPPRPLAPSQIVEDTDAMPPPDDRMRAAARRGTLLHSLFERLPGTASSERRALSARWLDRQGVAEAEAAEIADAALRVLDDPTFADLFGDGSLAEAPIAATLPDGRVIAGTVDRLCVGDTLIRVVDFKTGRFVPGNADAVPAAHRRQMEAYRDALQVIFPDRAVEIALLYTYGPRLIAL